MSIFNSIFFDKFKEKGITRLDISKNEKKIKYKRSKERKERERERERYETHLNTHTYIHTQQQQHSLNDLNNGFRQKMVWRDRVKRYFYIEEEERT